MKHSFWKHVFLPFILLSFSILFALGLFYAVFARSGNANWPFWAMWLVPLLFTIIGIWFLCDRLFKSQYLGSPWFNFITPAVFCLFLSLAMISVFMFIPLSKSIRYNLAKVTRLESVNNIKPYQSIDFLELDDWHVDRMRVMPFSYFEFAGGSRIGQVELNTLFVVPLFSKKDPYLTTAKAWMGFKYTDYVSLMDVIRGNEEEAEEHLRRSYSHFQKRDIGDFAYLEALPKNKVRGMFQQLAAAHTYYTSAYDNVFIGQEVERDVLSMYYLKFSVFLYLIVALPIALIASGILLWIHKRNEPLTKL